jgi:hypothetical protein
MLKDTFDYDEINQRISKLWEISYVFWPRIINRSHYNFLRCPLSYRAGSNMTFCIICTFWQLSATTAEHPLQPGQSLQESLLILKRYLIKKQIQPKKKYLFRSILITETSLAKFYNPWHLLDVLIFYSDCVNVKLHTIYKWRFQFIWAAKWKDCFGIALK